MTTFETFQEEFFKIFAINNFSQGKSYLEYIANPQSNDEDNIVDTKIVLPLLFALGFESGDMAKNITTSGKDNSRPDFQVSLTQGNIRCFLIENKHTAYNLNRPEPLQQLVNYAASRGYELGLVCNGRLLIGWDLSNPNSPNPVLQLDLEQILKTYLTGKSLTNEQIQALKALYRRFSKSSFLGIDILIQNISKPESEWLKTTISQANNSNFDELLIQDLREAIKLLEEDVIYQLELFSKEYQEYSQAKYLPNGNDSEYILIKLRKEILTYFRVAGAELLEIDDYSWADAKLLEFAETPKGSIQELADHFLNRLNKAAENAKNKQNTPSETYQQLDLLPPVSLEKQKELDIKIKPPTKNISLDSHLIECLRKYEEIVLDWKAWQVQQNLTYEQAIKTYQYFTSWKNLITKTVFQGADESKLKEEFARQTAYVYVIRLLMVRICEDKGLINRKFSNGGFKQWMENVIPQYLDFAQGKGLDYLLEISYRSAQSIYTHFFSGDNLFNWYRINTNTLIRVLDILNRFNLERVDSDIIGMVYGRYVIEGKHEQGRYFTPPEVVEYILDSIGYTSDNPEIRDKKLLDLAGGSGSFLVHAALRLINSYRSPTTGKIPTENIPFIIQQVKNSLYCLDINPFACYLAETNLLIQVIDLFKQVKDVGKLPECTIDRFNVYNTDTLLLPLSQQIRTPLLNPVLNLELSTLSQIKTKTGTFVEGFDFIVGNPPYVRADEPGAESYRRIIEKCGRFETLHEKWDLFVPFVELACKLSKAGGKIGLIVSRAFQTNNYAELLRNYIAKNLKVLQVDFFNNVSLFVDAVVSNTIFVLENSQPDDLSEVKRILHINSFTQTEELERLNQKDFQAKVFRQFVLNSNLEDVTYLEDICYCTIGMVLNADEKKAKGLFKKDELLTNESDAIHCKKYLDGENIIRELSINTIRYLEWGTQRVPNQIRRPTIPELYDLPKILFGMTSFPTYDRGINQGDGFYVPDSVRVCVKWEEVYHIQRLASEPRQMYEISKKRQRELGDSQGKKIQIYEYARDKLATSLKFDLRYITAILASEVGKRLLLMNNRDENIMSIGSDGKLAKSRIYPDDLKEFPIKNLSSEQQQPFIDNVDYLLEHNWEIYNLCQQGHIIKFNYASDEIEVKVNFRQVLNQLNLPCWSFGNAEPQRFEVIGHRTLPLQKIKIKSNCLFNGKDPLVSSNSTLVLQYLKDYLCQYEGKGYSWSMLLQEGKIPKTDLMIEEIFNQCSSLCCEIRQKVESMQQTYRELNELVAQLYRF